MDISEKVKAQVDIVEVMALGQTYFAILTRRQEVQNYFNQVVEDNKRFVFRGDIKRWNQMLAETARNPGAISEEELESGGGGFLPIQALSFDSKKGRKWKGGWGIGIG